MNTRIRILSVLLATAAAVPITAGCASSSDDGEADAVCEYRVEYNGNTYGTIANIKFEAGDKLGTATEPPCKDTSNDDNQEKPGKTQAYAVQGLDPETAIAVGDSPAEAKFVVVNPGKSLPPEVQKLVGQG
ncbi:DUF6281 family protein [Streptomyces europaeiscabiei]|uniref:DUF6281 family protein n=1 Tax=Streptomyces europaeiscabiei TaxID=146819 RepID=UPI002E28A67A|nr:DUF6281 family protein [Streptomyces europaeiscabiei]